MLFCVCVSYRLLQLFPTSHCFKLPEQLSIHHPANHSLQIHGVSLIQPTKSQRYTWVKDGGVSCNRKKPTQIHFLNDFLIHLMLGKFCPILSEFCIFDPTVSLNMIFPWNTFMRQECNDYCQVILSRNTTLTFTTMLMAHNYAFLLSQMTVMTYAPWLPACPQSFTEWAIIIDQKRNCSTRPGNLSQNKREVTSLGVILGSSLGFKLLLQITGRISEP